MKNWCDKSEPPLVISSGLGSWIEDKNGNRYLDGNSSIWTNIHGHQHPVIDQAIRDQLDKIAHSSFLGLSNEPASLLAEKLVHLFPKDTLNRVFLSDDGSTAMECALKMALQYWQQKGDTKCQKRTQFISFDHAYHGDTLGAASLGGIGAFAGGYKEIGLPHHKIKTLDDLIKIDPSQIAGVVIEPLVQGAAGIKTWPDGMLKELRNWTHKNGTLLILDEVLTGFGRTGTMFACQKENVTPDIIGLAKGLTGGYLPLAVTMATEEIFQAFLGDYHDTFFYGHSYTGNPLGCATALANLSIFETENTLDHLPEKITHTKNLLEQISETTGVIGEIRQCGMIAGFDLKNKDATPLDWELLSGVKVCQLARNHGLITRPVRDTIVFMPPLNTSLEDIEFGINCLEKALLEWNAL